MKASRSLGPLAVGLLSLSSVSSAWSWSLPDLDALLVRRDDSKTTTTLNAANTFNLNTGAVATSTGTDSAPAETATETATTGKKTTATGTTGTGTAATTTGTGKTTGTGTNTGKTTGTGKTTSGTKTTKGATHTTFDVQDPVGSIVMITPSTTAYLELYKIGDYITWGWNYTNLQATPTAVDVLASCSFATRTFTLTQNMTFETPGTFTWDTAAYQSDNVGSPLLTEEYTLLIYDADSSVSATAEAGYLDTFDGFTFGLYAPQSYTPLADGWKCATCSGALSATEQRAVGFALAMSLVTVLSFTWFVTGRFTL